MRTIRCALAVAMLSLASVASCGIEPESATGEQGDPAGADTITQTTAALTAVTNSCVCLPSAGCGNGAVGGNKGGVKTGLSTASVITNYGPDRTGTAATGWACRPEGTNSCVCIGISQGVGCGNGAVGGNVGVVKTGLSTSSVIASYGPDRTAGAATGWKCRISGF